MSALAYRLPPPSTTVTAPARQCGGHRSPAARPTARTQGLRSGQTPGPTVLVCHLRKYLFTRSTKDTVTAISPQFQGPAPRTSFLRTHLRPVCRV